MGQNEYRAAVMGVVILFFPMMAAVEAPWFGDLSAQAIGTITAFIEAVVLLFFMRYKGPVVPEAITSKSPRRRKR